MYYEIYFLLHYETRTEPLVKQAQLALGTHFSILEGNLGIKPVTIITTHMNERTE